MVLVLGDYRLALGSGGKIADHVLQLGTATRLWSTKRQSGVVM